MLTCTYAQHISSQSISYLELVSDKGNTFKLKALNEESIALQSRTVTSKQKLPVSATPSVRAAERSVELNPNSRPHKKLNVLVQYSKEMERHASIVSENLDDLKRKHNQLKRGRTASPHATPMDADYELMLATPARTAEDKGIYSTSLPNAASTSLPNAASTSLPNATSTIPPRPARPIPPRPARPIPRPSSLQVQKMVDLFLKQIVIFQTHLRTFRR
jgi:hypothetical protein